MPDLLGRDLLLACVKAIQAGVTSDYAVDRASMSGVLAEAISTSTKAEVKQALDTPIL